MIDYEDAIKWIDELNKEGQWKRLATKLKLKYHQVKDLGLYEFFSKIFSQDHNQISSNAVNNPD